MTLPKGIVNVVVCPLGMSGSNAHIFRLKFGSKFNIEIKMYIFFCTIKMFFINLQRILRKHAYNQIFFRKNIFKNFSNMKNNILYIVYSSFLDIFTH